MTCDDAMTCAESGSYSMIRKSMPSGNDPMGGHRFSEEIMLKQ